MRLDVIFMAIWFAAPATAQSLFVDQGSIRACHVSADIADTTPHCLGSAANQCQGLPGGGTTLGISQCIQSETAVWDTVLNEEYKATRAKFRQRGDGLPEAFLSAQRAWITYRDAECALQYSRWQGGTIRSIVFANCMMVFTATRAIELRDMRGD